jgi:small-conductance mechanosensitive channel
MRNDLPAAVEFSVIAASLLRWLADNSTRLMIAAFACFIIVLALYAIRGLGRKLGKGGLRWRSIFGRATGSMTLWFMLSVAAQIVARYMNAPAEIAVPINIIFVIVATFQGAAFLREVILGGVERRAGEDDPQGNLDSALGLIRLLVTVSLFVIAVVLILANLGVNVNGLLAGLGIGGIAIGLAAQGIFSDLFAALSILFDKPFRRGDLIRWETTTGTVEAIGLKTTRIRSLSGEEIVVSNTNLLGKELRNFARLETRRITQTLSLVYHTPVETCAGLSALLQPAIDACEGCTFIRCGLDDFGASSLDFRLVYDICAPDQERLLSLKNAANIAILTSFEGAKIHFAYPSQTTYSAAPDGSLVMPWAPLPR